MLTSWPVAARQQASCEPQSRVKTRRRTSRLKSNRTRLKSARLRAATTTTWLLISMIVQLVLHASVADEVVASQSTSRTEQESSPAVVVPKFGLIRGLKFQPAGSDKSQAVAAFLGVPYAAPPTGPLRFMPPGAVRPSQTRSSNGGEQCLLLPSRSSAPSRLLGKFGHECVQLDSWLRPRPAAAATDLGQSEDCLNLNLFVPYEPSGGHLREPIKRAPSSAEANRSISETSDSAQESMGQMTTIPAGAAQNDTPTRLKRASTDPTATPNDKSISLNESWAQEHLGDRTHCYLDQIGASQQLSRPRPMPVLVVFHSKKRAPPPTSGPERTPAEQQPQQSDNKANSLAFVEVAQRAQAIVVTFNYRIGLLGYLPYIDQMDQFQHSSGSLTGSSSGQARYNHAIWDQLGLLHWLKHNIANFNGDPNNVTLVSADNEAARHIQLLAMSPISRGLFARLALVHVDQRRDKQGATNGLDRLLELAIISREMKRKLINEMSLLVRKLRGENSSSIEDDNNIELDRNMFEFLKDANLTELASFESKLSELKLVEFISEPNLDDRMLFPYFAQLIKMQQPLARILASTGDRNATFGGRRTETGDNVGGLFWSALNLMPNRFAPNDSSESLLSPGAADRIELDYCLYLGQLYEGIFALDPGRGKPLKVQDIAQIDPFRLIPHVNEHMIQVASRSLASLSEPNSPNQRLIQKSSPSPWLSPWSWFRANSNAGDSSESENNAFATGPGLPKGNWTQSRLVSATEFHHLRNVHLLNQLLVDKLNAIGRSQGEQADEDDEEDDNLLQKQQRSLLLMSQHQQDSIGNPNPRAKRDTLTDQLALLGDQLMELISSYDLLIGFIGKPLKHEVKQQQPSQTRSNHSNAIVSSLLNITQRDGLQLDPELAFWLRMADLHFVSHAFKSHGHHFHHLRDDARGNSCDFISDKIQGIKQRAEEPDAPATGKYDDLRSKADRSTFVFLAKAREMFAMDSSENDWILDVSGHLFGPVRSFVHSGQASEVPFANSQMNQTLDRYNTMSRHINLLGDLLKNETKSELENYINVHFNLVPYLEQRNFVPASSQRPRAHHEHFMSTANDLSHKLLTPPRELFSCLHDLELKLKQTGVPLDSNELSTGAKFTEDSHCLSGEVGKLRGQLRSGAGKELEPLVIQFLASLAISRSFNTTNSTAKNYSHQLSDRQLALMNQNQRVSSMTTRNLVNQSEGMYLDQFEASGMIVGLNDQSGGDTRSTITGKAKAESSRTSFDQASLRVNQFANATTSSIRSFFAKTYKDAVGQALGIVIGTGALIFLLNLIIVLVIAIRSARHSRQAEGKRRNCAAVQDVNQMQYLTPSFDAPIDELAVQRDYQTSQMNSNNSNGSVPNKSKLIAEGKQLTSSFKQQPDICDANSTRKRSVKSIKFNLSGIDGQTDDSDYRDNKLNQVPYALDANTVTESHSIEKNPCLLHAGQARVVPNTFGTRDQHHGQQQQQQHQYQLTSSSPSYLLNEFSDEIDLEQTSADEEERQFQKYLATSNNAMHLDGGPIYVTHQHQLADFQGDSSSSNGCRLHSQNQHRFNRSLGSSSLTSPFASQTTPSNTTSSNSTAIYTIQAADMSSNSELNFMQTLVSQSNQAEMFLANHQMLYSPSSSTLSNETPIRPPQRTVSMMAQQIGQHPTSCAYHQVQTDSMKRASFRTAGSQGNLVAQDQENSYLIYAPQSSKHMAGEQRNSLDPANVQLLIMPTGNNLQEVHQH